MRFGVKYEKKHQVLVRSSLSLEAFSAIKKCLPK